MQENNRFFQLVWRVNALAIAGVVVLAGLLGIYALYSFLKEETRDRIVKTKPTTKPQQPRQEEMRFGAPIPIPGSPFARIPLYRELKTNLTYFTKSSGSNSVNELFVHSTNGQSAWLFKGGNRLIVDESLVLSQLKSDQPNVTSILYTLVEKDTSGDERLSFDDKVSVGYSTPDGSTYTPLLDNIDKLFAIEQVADDRLMILYARQGENRLITYTLPTYTIINDSAPPKLEEKP